MQRRLNDERAASFEQIGLAFLAHSFKIGLSCELLSIDLRPPQLDYRPQLSGVVKRRWK